MGQEGFHRLAALYCERNCSHFANVIQELLNKLWRRLVNVTQELPKNFGRRLSMLHRSYSRNCGRILPMVHRSYSINCGSVLSILCRSYLRNCRSVLSMLGGQEVLKKRICYSVSPMQVSGLEIFFCTEDCKYSGESREGGYVCVLTVT